MGVLDVLHENMNWRKDHQVLISFLNAGNIVKAIDFYQQHFNKTDDVLRFPTIVKTIENSLEACFKKDSATKNFNVLGLENAIKIRDTFLKGDNAQVENILSSEKLLEDVKKFVIFQLQQGDFDSINQAIKARSEFLEESFDVLSDRNLRRAVLQALVVNFINKERIYSQNIDKITKTFLVDKEYMLVGAALSAVGIWNDRERLDRANDSGRSDRAHDRERSDRANEINTKYVWGTGMVKTEKRKAA